MRIDPSLNSTILADLNQSQSTLDTALQEVATGVDVNQPSDNPTAAATMVENQLETHNVDAYTQNASTALSTVQSASSILSSVVSSLNSAESAGVEGGNGTTSPAEMKELGSQVQSILSSIISGANTSVNGTYLFGGSSTTAPYTADATSPTGYTYTGNDDVTSVAVGDGTSVAVNQPGSQVFSNSTTNVIGSLSTLITALNSGDPSAVQAAVPAVNASISYISQQQVFYSNAESQISNQESFLQSDTVTLSQQATNLVGISEATAATNLSQAETDNSAALAAMAKVMPNSLLNYLSSPS